MKQILVIFLLFAKLTEAQDTTRLSVLFFGDIMQHDSQISDAWNPATKSYDYDPCFQYVKPYMESVDLAIGNLELTLAGPPYKGYPQFSAPDQLLTGLQNMGVDVLVTANNHCVDTGKKGLERTIRMLDSLKIPHTGTFKDTDEKVINHPLIVKRNGFTLALLNYTFSTNGLPVASPNIVNMIDTAAIRRDLVKAKTLKPDLITVFFHWGNEYESLPSAWQKMIGEHTLKHGAQLVIGAHPHVIQPMEWRKDKNQLIAYSLGNFVSGQRKRYTDGGSMIRIELEKIEKQDSSFTRIDTANYILEWVQRDLQKNYFVLPVWKVMSNTALIKNTESLDAFNTFVNDSHELLATHNKGVEEFKFVPPDVNVQYSVRFFVGKKGTTTEKFATPVPYEVFTRPANNGDISYYSGVFVDRAEAEKYLKKIKRDLGYKDAQVLELRENNR